MEECVFCNRKNINEQGILYEDEKCLVILDKYPITKGHILVIPKRHYPNMLETPRDVVDDSFEVARMAGTTLMKRLKPGGLNITTNIGRIAGQYIMHFHVHVIPRYEYENNPEDKFPFDHNTEISKDLKEELGKLLSMRKGSVHA
jgi:histidine triad (HIT) family protein